MSEQLDGRLAVGRDEPTMLLHIEKFSRLAIGMQTNSKLKVIDFTSTPVNV